MRKYVVGAIISICFSIPITLFATYAWIDDDGTKDGVVRFSAYLIFKLGMPLTLIPEWLNLQFSNKVFLNLILPILLSFLFIVQWVIWSLLITFTFFRKKDSKLSKLTVIR